ncbi:MAG TPA: hypothetical protein VFC78_10420 [Tepidisphaeraceae bacterium]|nr:hypothetical protein [Tepidisphaeraceae bacterium]
MKNSKKLHWLIELGAAAAVIALAAGCQNPKSDAARGDDFPAPDMPRSVNAFAMQQAANGARADATLRDYHFDGGKLNSLGEERLDLMVHNGDDCSPLVVYLDVPADEANTESRRQAVTDFLRHSGLSDEQIKLEDGPNPNSTSPVAPLLAQQNMPQQSSASPAAPSSGSMPQGQ